MDGQLTRIGDKETRRRFLSATLMPELTHNLRQASHGAVHVLRLADIGHHDWACFRRMLDAAETQRAEAFRFRADRDAYIAAHGLLRLALASRLGVEPTELYITAQRGHKPILRSSSTIDFSLSHTRGCVACIVADGIKVGIDVEATRNPAPDAEDLLAHEEIVWLKTRPTSLAASDLAALWCRKEALLKSLGLYEPVNMRTISVAPGATVKLPARSGSFERCITVKSHLTHDNLHIAVAFQSTDKANEAVQIF